MKRATSMEHTSHLQGLSSFSCIPLDASNWCSRLRFSRRSSDHKSNDDVHDPLQQSPISSQRLVIFASWRGLWRRIVSEKRKILSSRAPMQVHYDEYSYAKNFDEGVAWIELDNLCRSFSARFAVPSSTFLLQRCHDE